MNKLYLIPFCKQTKLIFKKINQIKNILYILKLLFNLFVLEILLLFWILLLSDYFFFLDNFLFAIFMQKSILLRFNN